MKLKIPPVVVVLIFGLLMYILVIFLPVGNFDFFGRLYIMILFLIITTILWMTSLVQFYKTKTTIDPRIPSKTLVLVTGGIYKYTRNPMYLGMLLVIMAWGLWLQNAFNILLVASFVKYMNAFQIIPEEEILLKKFGRAYKKYCIAVRRWF